MQTFNQLPNAHPHFCKKLTIKVFLVIKKSFKNTTEMGLFSYDFIKKKSRGNLCWSKLDSLFLTYFISITAKDPSITQHAATTGVN